MSSECRDSSNSLNTKQKYSDPNGSPCWAYSLDVRLNSPNCRYDAHTIEDDANGKSSGKYFDTTSRIESRRSVLNAFLKSIFRTLDHLPFYLYIDGQLEL